MKMKVLLGFHFWVMLVVVVIGTGFLFPAFTTLSTSISTHGNFCQPFDISQLTWLSIFNSVVGDSDILYFSFVLVVFTVPLSLSLLEKLVLPFCFVVANYQLYVCLKENLYLLFSCTTGKFLSRPMGCFSLHTGFGYYPSESFTM